MSYSLIKEFNQLTLDSNWMSEMLRTQKLIHFVQSHLGSKCYDLFQAAIQSSESNSDLEIIRDDFESFDKSLHDIYDLFPVQASIGIREQFSRAFNGAKGKLSNIEPLLNLTEERFATKPESIEKTELKPLPVVQTKGYRFDILWEGNFRWLKNLCGYQNRYSDSVDSRRASLSTGVYRIGNYQVIVEYLDWVCQTNTENPHMQNAIQRWQEDIKWLQEKYQYS